MRIKIGGGNGTVMVLSAILHSNVVSSHLITKYQKNSLIALFIGRFLIMYANFSSAA